MTQSVTPLLLVLQGMGVLEPQFDCLVILRHTNPVTISLYAFRPGSPLTPVDEWTGSGRGCPWVEWSVRLWTEGLSEGTQKWDGKTTTVGKDADGQRFDDEEGVLSPVLLSGV